MSRRSKAKRQAAQRRQAMAAKDRSHLLTTGDYRKPTIEEQREMHPEAFRETQLHLAIEKPPPSRETQMGNVILADFTLIECPSWDATMDVHGEPDLVRAIPDWPRTHVNPICKGCGRTISEEAPCPRMHAPETALAMLLRLKMPVASQHDELPPEFFIPEGAAR